MNLDHADQIAALLNERNQLSVKYDRDRVIRDARQYVFKLDKTVVIACVQVKPVQWYQAEILHLTVTASHAGKGLGKEMLGRALERARARRARIAQCTIREGNGASEGLFAALGFARVSRFLNEETGNHVGVWQKVIER